MSANRQYVVGPWKMGRIFLIQNFNLIKIILICISNLKNCLNNFIEITASHAILHEIILPQSGNIW